jgi:putative glutathione S-transferase
VISFVEHLEMSNTTSTEESQKNAAQRRAQGEFVRGISTCRNVIGETTDESGVVLYPAEPNRYHLFIAFNCPWCHRTALTRDILGLEASVTMDVCFPNRTESDDPAGGDRWEFNPRRVASSTGAELPECTFETATGKQMRLVTDVYKHAGVTDQTSVPILFDKKTQTVVSNESAEIIRMMSLNAKGLGATRSELAEHLYPTAATPDAAARREAIAALNEFVYNAVNNGAYKAGFSSNQAVYEKAFLAYFEALEALDVRLRQHTADGPFLLGKYPSEADVRLFPTVFRHDPVYYNRMKLNGAKILDYPHLWRWVCAVYAIPGVAEASPLQHSVQGYFGRSDNRVVPVGPFKPMRYPAAYQHPELARD